MLSVASVREGAASCLYLRLKATTLTKPVLQRLGLRADGVYVWLCVGV